MKRRIQCPTNGVTAGGTLCFTCQENINTVEGTCIEWVAQRGPLGCHKCLKDCGGALFTCEICESEICESCTEDICLKKFFEEDISYFVCTHCIPFSLRTNSKGQSTTFIGDRKHDFCVFCQDFHLSEAFGGEGCDFAGHNCPPLIKKLLSLEATVPSSSHSLQNAPNVPNSLDSDTTAPTGNTTRANTSQIENNNTSKPTVCETQDPHSAAQRKSTSTAHDIEIRDLMAQQSAKITSLTETVALLLKEKVVNSAQREIEERSKSTQATPKAIAMETKAQDTATLSTTEKLLLEFTNLSTSMVKCLNENTKTLSDLSKHLKHDNHTRSKRQGPNNNPPSRNNTNSRSNGRQPNNPSRNRQPEASRNNN